MVMYSGSTRTIGPGTGIADALPSIAHAGGRRPSPYMLSRVFVFGLSAWAFANGADQLKDQFHGELDRAPGARGQNPAEVRIVERAHGGRKICAVEAVEKLRAKLVREAFPHPGVLADVEIEVDGRRPIVCVAG